MDRRALLATMSVGAVSLAGCVSNLSGVTPPPDSFEQCDTLTIGIEQLPDPAQNEVETALENPGEEPPKDGHYETEDELYLPHVIDIETTYLERSSDYFQADVESIGETNRLTLSRETPTLGTRALNLENHTEDPQTIEIRIWRLRDDDDDRELVLETTTEIDEGETITVGEFDRRFGDYLAEGTINGTTHQTTWQEEAGKDAVRWVSIFQEDGEVGFGAGVQPHSHNDGFDCSWEPN